MPAQHSLSTLAERQKVAEIQEAIELLPLPCIAAICKHAMMDITRDETITLGQLDVLTDQDPEL
jgi:hypothetical protein